jgi:hypothetical protein
VSEATIEHRNGKWVVLYAGAVVGRHTAKYKAKQQADTLNNNQTEETDNG